MQHMYVLLMQFGPEPPLSWKKKKPTRQEQSLLRCHRVILVDSLEISLFLC